MFLSLLKRRNPEFLEAAAELHRSGAIPPNCFVIDLDAVRRNAHALRQESTRLSLQLFAMTKQIGRNPDVSRALVECGITHAVGVDLECATVAAAGGLACGNVGHLVQVPRNQTRAAAALRPLYWTVFNEEKAVDAGRAAMELGRTQDVLLRVVGRTDQFYAGHEGGFEAGEVVAVADRLDRVPGIRVAGVTSFPATLYDAQAGTVRTTSNLQTLSTASQSLAASGRARVQLNAPGTTSSGMLHLIADAGATQAEPGHGLTGTTPWHATTDLVEDPAIAYVSEVSHVWNNKAFVFGGGLYVDPVLGATGTGAIVVRDADRGPLHSPVLPVEMPASGAIDYYATIPIDSPERDIIGSTVLFGFRPQVFVTRALTAAVEGISTGSPSVLGIWASNGCKSPTADAESHSRENAGP